MATSQSPDRPGAKCPICDRPTDETYRPFCSRRCADVDLSRWLRGTYAFPDADESEDGDEGRPDSNASKTGQENN
jgi:endogenous inhibitor of DNA gyrase (YacG/DUF329 family)